MRGGGCGNWGRLFPVKVPGEGISRVADVYTDKEVCAPLPFQTEEAADALLRVEGVLFQVALGFDFALPVHDFLDEAFGLVVVVIGEEIVREARPILLVFHAPLELVEAECIPFDDPAFAGDDFGKYVFRAEHDSGVREVLHEEVYAEIGAEIARHAGCRHADEEAVALVVDPLFVVVVFHHGGSVRPVVGVILRQPCQGQA